MQGRFLTGSLAVQPLALTSVEIVSKFSPVTAFYQHRHEVLDLALGRLSEPSEGMVGLSTFSPCLPELTTMYPKLEH